LNRREDAQQQRGGGGHQIMQPAERRRWQRGRKKCERSSRERKTNLTLKLGFVYHVMNNVCIHLRAKGLNIYIYIEGGKYIKNLLKKYNNKKY
jgi:hypothetical protein